MNPTDAYRKELRKKELKRMADFRFESRHNQSMQIDLQDLHAVQFQEILQFLLRSRVHHAITHHPVIYEQYVRGFWDTISYDSTVDPPVIRAEVGGQAMQFSKADLHRVLQLGGVYQENLRVEFPEDFRIHVVTRMGYTGDAGGRITKAHLFGQWRLLAHLIVQCLSGKKAGFDRLSHVEVSLMAALTYNKPYDYAGFFFGNFREIISTRVRDRFLLYPRFVQMLISDSLPNLPVVEGTLLVGRVSSRIFADCRNNKSGRPLADIETDLFGHLVNVNYVAPDNDGWEDVVGDEPAANAVEGDAPDAEVAEQPLPPLVDIPVAEIIANQALDQEGNQEGGVDELVQGLFQAQNPLEHVLEGLDNLPDLNEQINFDVFPNAEHVQPHEDFDFEQWADAHGFAEVAVQQGNNENVVQEDIIVEKLEEDEPEGREGAEAEGEDAVVSDSSDDDDDSAPDSRREGIYATRVSLSPVATRRRRRTSDDEDADYVPSDDSEELTADKGKAPVMPEAKRARTESDVRTQDPVFGASSSSGPAVFSSSIPVVSTDIPSSLAVPVSEPAASTVVPHPPVFSDVSRVVELENQVSVLQSNVESLQKRLHDAEAKDVDSRAQLETLQSQAADYNRQIADNDIAIAALERKYDSKFTGIRAHYDGRLFQMNELLCQLLDRVDRQESKTVVLPDLNAVVNNMAKILDQTRKDHQTLDDKVINQMVGASEVVVEIRRRLNRADSAINDLRRQSSDQQVTVSKLKCIFGVRLLDAF